MNKWKFYQEINTETNRASEIICFEDRNGFLEFFIYLFIYFYATKESNSKKDM